MKRARKKRVVLAVTNDLVSDNRVHKIALTLGNMGFDVTLAGRRYPSGKINLRRPYTTHHFSLWFNKGPLFYANYNIRLFFYLLFNRFDVIVSNDLDTLPACFYASLILRIQLVYDSHEYFTEVPELIERPKVKRIWERIEEAILPKIIHCYTVCQSIAEIYNEKYRTNFRVVRNIPFKIDEIGKEYFAPPFPTNKPIVIYQGAVNLGRGIEEAILSMRFIENVNLVIIGSGDIIDECKKLAKDEGLTDRVIFTGRIPIDELSKITRFATIGLSVEKDMGLNYRYALPNKLFDYIQSEVPMLTSALPEIKRIVDDYGVGLIISETTPESIAKGIKQMLGDVESFRLWKGNCKIAKEILCWENEREVIQSIYMPFLR